MEEQIFIYSMFAMFVGSIYKSFKQGGTCELITLIFFLIGFFFAVALFDITLKSTLSSLAVFFMIYGIGLFLSYFNKNYGTFEKITGLALGVVKFFTFLCITTTVAMLMDPLPDSFKNQFFVKLILPYSKKLTHAIIEYKKNQKKFFKK